VEVEQFQRSLSDAEPPEGLSDAMRVLWFDGRGDWDLAHGIAQDMRSDDGAWLHGFLHRREGDLPNADYWYRRAGRRRPEADLEAEWRSLVVWFGSGRESAE